MARKIPVMEIFGPTIQGEGMVVGQKTMFLRTGGCDYSCSWCDSAFTWNGEQKATMMTAQEVFERLIDLGTSMVPYYEVGEAVHANSVPLGWNSARNFNHVTISGGNPALVGEPMAELIRLLKAQGIKVGLETQGSRWQDWFLEISDLTISPKPPSSGMKTDWEKLDTIIRQLVHGRTHWEWNFTLKVVIFNDEDFEYAKKLRRLYPSIGFYVSVGNADAKEDGDISQRLLQELDWLWDKVIKDPEMNDVRPLPQLHTLVWANRRGV